MLMTDGEVVVADRAQPATFQQGNIQMHATHPRTHARTAMPLAAGGAADEAVYYSSPEPLAEKGSLPKQLLLAAQGKCWHCIYSSRLRVIRRKMGALVCKPSYSNYTCYR